MTTITNSIPIQYYDRPQEVKQFDESKIGVKGLVDSGLTTIPRIFHQPPHNLPTPKLNTQKRKLLIPIIDLSDPRSTVVDQIHHSASTLGLFQVINHGIPMKVMDHVLSSVKSFHELPESTNMQYYCRDMSRGAGYSTNLDLSESKAAQWKDSLKVRLGPTPPEWEYVPEVCREALAEWDCEVVKLGKELMGMLSEGLGLERGRLKDKSFMDSRNLAGHYYPYCPQPELTIGLKWHTDPGMLTVVLQNEIVGLQMKHGEDWIDVEPVPGGLVINIADMLQDYSILFHRSCPMTYTKAWSIECWLTTCVSHESLFHIFSAQARLTCCADHYQNWYHHRSRLFTGYLPAIHILRFHSEVLRGRVTGQDSDKLLQSRWTSREKHK